MKSFQESVYWRCLKGPTHFKKLEMKKIRSRAVLVHIQNLFFSWQNQKPVSKEDSALILIRRWTDILWKGRCLSRLACRFVSEFHFPSFCEQVKSSENLEETLISQIYCQLLLKSSRGLPEKILFHSNFVWLFTIFDVCVFRRN